MKIKIDENLPLRLGTLLKGLGHNVHTLQDERLVGHADEEIWAARQKNRAFLITQDLDFSDLRQFAPGSHHGILLVRLQAADRRTLIERISELFHGRCWGVDQLFCCCHRAKNSSDQAADRANSLEPI